MFEGEDDGIFIRDANLSNSDELQIPYPLAGAFAMNKEREAKRERKGNGSISSCTNNKKMRFIF